MKASLLSLSFVSVLLRSTLSQPPDLTSIPKQGAVLDKNQCDCYLVSGEYPGYFQNYEFYDFRRVPLHRNKANANTSTAGPHPLPPNDEHAPHFEDGVNRNDHVDDHVKRVFGSDATLLAHTPLERFWKPQNWLRRASATAPVTLINRKRNVFIARDPSGRNGEDSTFLVLRTVRREDHASTAEIESSIRNIFHASMRLRLRLFAASPGPDSGPDSDSVTAYVEGLPPPGACAGIFTYHSANCESDIEILTADPPNHVRYANQPDYDYETDSVIPGASTTVHITVPWTSWATHRIDWFPGLSRWFENDELLHATGYSVPNELSMMVVNLWSDGGIWSGDLKVGQDVYMAIEWIEMAYNVSASKHDSPVGKPSQRHSHRPYRAQRRDEAMEGTDGDSVELEVEAGVDTDTDSDVEMGKPKWPKWPKKPKWPWKPKKPASSCRRPCWVNNFHH